MMETAMRRLVASLVVLLGFGPLACATTQSAGGGAQASGEVDLQDPANDDFGPGSYVYPTDAVYKAGSFDMTRFQVVPQGDDIEFRVTLRSRIEDPWDSKAWGGNGFSIQMAVVFIDTDSQPGSGSTKGLPGLNVRFAPENAWDKAVIISPQPPTRVNSEIEQKAADRKDRIIVPKITRASGKTLIAVVDRAQLGGMPQPGWGYQVVLQSNEGFPDKSDLLTRKVNEFEGQHRFGGGTDYENDPHVLDILTGAARGQPDEVEQQKQVLSQYNKDATEPTEQDLAVLPMVYPGK
jgi:hypothetical protein